MDEKTEQLRDIFMDVTEEETVTERQAEQRGSLVRTESVDDRLAGVIGRMRERFDVETDLDDDQLCTVVRGFYDGDDDATIGERLGVSAAAVFEARMDLHLVSEDDAPAVDTGRLREHRANGASVDEMAAELGVSRETVERALQVIESRERSRRVSHRFRTEFEEILTDADIAVRLTAEVKDDGLAEAAEDIETETDF